MTDQERQAINIYTKVAVRVILIVVVAILLYVIRDILALFLMAVIITAAIEPAVDWLQKRVRRRSVAVLIIYLSLFTVVGSLFSIIIPQAVREFRGLTNDFPFLIERITDIFSGIERVLASFNITINPTELSRNIGDNISGSLGNLFRTTIGVFSGLLSSFIVFSMAFYMSARRDGIKNFLAFITPLPHQERVVNLAMKLKDKIGRWLVGQILLMVLIFVLYYILLSVLGVRYALFLAILGGLLEIIPYLGPIISAIPAVLIGFLVSPLTGLLVLFGYIFIQQVENHVIVPQIMRRAVGLNPVAVILALLVGAKLGGVIGALLAVPVAAGIGMVIDDFFAKENQSSGETSLNKEKDQGEGSR